MSEPTAIDVKFELMMEKIGNLYDKFDEHTEQDRENFGKIDQKIEKFIGKMDEVLLNSEKGAIIRLDRVEQREQRRSWLTKTAVGAGLSSILGHIWGFLKS